VGPPPKSGLAASLSNTSAAGVIRPATFSLPLAASLSAPALATPPSSGTGGARGASDVSLPGAAAGSASASTDGRPPPPLLNAAGDSPASAPFPLASSNSTPLSMPLPSALASGGGGGGGSPRRRPSRRTPSQGSVSPLLTAASSPRPVSAGWPLPLPVAPPSPARSTASAAPSTPRRWPTAVGRLGARRHGRASSASSVGTSSAAAAADGWAAADGGWDVVPAPVTPHSPALAARGRLGASTPASPAPAAAAGDDGGWGARDEAWDPVSPAGAAASPARRGSRSGGRGGGSTTATPSPRRSAAASPASAAADGWGARDDTWDLVSPAVAAATLARRGGRRGALAAATASPARSPSAASPSRAAANDGWGAEDGEWDVVSPAASRSPRPAASPRGHASAAAAAAAATLTVAAAEAAGDAGWAVGDDGWGEVTPPGAGGGTAPPASTAKQTPPSRGRPIKGRLGGSARRARAAVAAPGSAARATAAVAGASAGGLPNGGLVDDSRAAGAAVVAPTLVSTSSSETAVLLAAPLESPPEALPESPPGAPPESPPEAPPESPPEAPPELPPEASPESPPEASPVSPPEAPPESPPEAPPELPPEASPESPPEASPVSPPEAPPESPPEAPPESPPEAPPESPPEAPPESPPEAPPESPPEAPPESPPEAPPGMPLETATHTAVPEGSWGKEGWDVLPEPASGPPAEATETVPVAVQADKAGSDWLEPTASLAAANGDGERDAAAGESPSEVILPTAVANDTPFAEAWDSDWGMPPTANATSSPLSVGAAPLLDDAVAAAAGPEAELLTAPEVASAPEPQPPVDAAPEPEPQPPAEADVCADISAAESADGDWVVPPADSAIASLPVKEPASEAAPAEQEAPRSPSLTAQAETSAVADVVATSDAVPNGELAGDSSSADAAAAVIPEGSFLPLSETAASSVLPPRTPPEAFATVVPADALAPEGSWGEEDRDTLPATSSGPPAEATETALVADERTVVAEAQPLAEANSPDATPAADAWNGDWEVPSSDGAVATPSAVNPPVEAATAEEDAAASPPLPPEASLVEKDGPTRARPLAAAAPVEEPASAQRDNDLVTPTLPPPPAAVAPVGKEPVDAAWDGDWGVTPTAADAPATATGLPAVREGSPCAAVIQEDEQDEDAAVVVGAVAETPAPKVDAVEAVAQEELARAAADGVSRGLEPPGSPAAAASDGEPHAADGRTKESRGDISLAAAAAGDAPSADDWDGDWDGPSATDAAASPLPARSPIEAAPGEENTAVPSPLPAEAVAAVAAAVGLEIAPETAPEPEVQPPAEADAPADVPPPDTPGAPGDEAWNGDWDVLPAADAAPCPPSDDTVPHPAGASTVIREPETASEGVPEPDVQPPTETEKPADAPAADAPAAEARDGDWSVSLNEGAAGRLLVEEPAPVSHAGEVSAASPPPPAETVAPPMSSPVLPVAADHLLAPVEAPSAHEPRSPPADVEDAWGPDDSWGPDDDDWGVPPTDGVAVSLPVDVSPVAAMAAEKEGPRSPHPTVGDKAPATADVDVRSAADTPNGGFVGDSQVVALSSPPAGAVVLPTEATPPPVSAPEATATAASPPAVKVPAASELHSPADVEDGWGLDDTWGADDDGWGVPLPDGASASPLAQKPSVAAAALKKDPPRSPPPSSKAVQVDSVDATLEGKLGSGRPPVAAEASAVPEPHLPADVDDAWGPDDDGWGALALEDDTVDDIPDAGNSAVAEDLVDGLNGVVLAAAPLAAAVAATWAQSRAYVAAGPVPTATEEQAPAAPDVAVPSDGEGGDEGPSAAEFFLEQQQVGDKVDGEGGDAEVLDDSWILADLAAEEEAKAAAEAAAVAEAEAAAAAAAAADLTPVTSPVASSGRRDDAYGTDGETGTVRIIDTPGDGAGESMINDDSYGFGPDDSAFDGADSGGLHPSATSQFSASHPPFALHPFAPSTFVPDSEVVAVPTLHHMSPASLGTLPLPTGGFGSFAPAPGVASRSPELDASARAPPPPTDLFTALSPALPPSFPEAATTLAPGQESPATPLDHRCRISFGFGGVVAVTAAPRPSDDSWAPRDMVASPPTVRIYTLRDVVPVSASVDVEAALEAPAPANGEPPPLAAYVPMCERMAARATSTDAAVLWRLLALAARRPADWRADTAAADVAAALVGPASSGRLGAHRPNGVAAAGAAAGPMLPFKREDEPLLRRRATRVQALVACGRLADAQAAASDGELWPLALILASTGGPGCVGVPDATRSFAAASFADSSSLRTLCEVAAGGPITAAGGGSWAKSAAALVGMRRRAALSELAGDGAAARAHVCRLLATPGGAADPAVQAAQAGQPIVLDGFGGATTGSGAASTLATLVWEAAEVGAAEAAASAAAAAAGRPPPPRGALPPGGVLFRALLPHRLRLAAAVASVGRLDDATAHVQALIAAVRAAMAAHAGAGGGGPPPVGPAFLGALRDLELRLAAAVAGRAPPAPAAVAGSKAGAGGRWKPKLFAASAKAAAADEGAPPPPPTADAPVDVRTGGRARRLDGLLDSTVKALIGGGDEPGGSGGGGKATGAFPPGFEPLGGMPPAVGRAPPAVGGVPPAGWSAAPSPGDGEGFLSVGPPPLGPAPAGPALPAAPSPWGEPAPATAGYGAPGSGAPVDSSGFGSGEVADSEGGAPGSGWGAAPLPGTDGGWSGPQQEFSVAAGDSGDGGAGGGGWGAAPPAGGVGGWSPPGFAVDAGGAGGGGGGASGWAPPPTAVDAGAVGGEGGGWAPPAPAEGGPTEWAAAPNAGGGDAAQGWAAPHADAAPDWSAPPPSAAADTAGGGSGGAWAPPAADEGGSAGWPAAETGGSDAPAWAPLAANGASSAMASTGWGSAPPTAAPAVDAAPDWSVAPPAAAVDAAAPGEWAAAAPGAATEAAAPDGWSTSAIVGAAGGWMPQQPATAAPTGAGQGWQGAPPQNGGWPAPTPEADAGADDAPGGWPTPQPDAAPVALAADGGGWGSAPAWGANPDVIPGAAAPEAAAAAEAVAPAVAPVNSGAPPADWATAPPPTSATESAAEPAAWAAPAPGPFPPPMQPPVVPAGDGGRALQPAWSSPAVGSAFGSGPAGAADASAAPLPTPPAEAPATLSAAAPTGDAFPPPPSDPSSRGDGSASRGNSPAPTPTTDGTSAGQPRGRDAAPAPVGRAAERAARRRSSSWGSFTDRLRTALAKRSGVKQAHMGAENQFVYDEAKGRWVMEGEEDDGADDAPPPLPPAPAFVAGARVGDAGGGGGGGPGPGVAGGALPPAPAPSAVLGGGAALPPATGGRPPTGAPAPAGLAPSASLPPRGAGPNMYSAGRRSGARSRYVDTFGGGDGGVGGGGGGGRPPVLPRGGSIRAPSPLSAGGPPPGGGGADSPWHNFVPPPPRGAPPPPEASEGGGGAPPLTQTAAVAPAQ